MGTAEENVAANAPPPSYFGTGQPAGYQMQPVYQPVATQPIAGGPVQAQPMYSNYQPVRDEGRFSAKLFSAEVFFSQSIFRSIFFCFV